MTTICGIQNKGCVNEGSDSTLYVEKLFDKDGQEVTTPESVEYKLSDGENILIDWTDFTPTTVPITIPIDGQFNRVGSSGLTNRSATIHFVSGGEDTFQPIKYTIVDDPNVTETSPEIP